MARDCAGFGSVEALLGGLEAFARDRLDCVCGFRDQRLDVDLGVEVGEDVVRDRAAVASARSPDSDSQAKEVLRPERRRDRAQPVVAREAAAAPGLEPPRLEVDVVVDDEERVGRRP